MRFRGAAAWSCPLGGFFMCVMFSLCDVLFMLCSLELHLVERVDEGAMLGARAVEPPRVGRVLGLAHLGRAQAQVRVRDRVRDRARVRDRVRVRPRPPPPQRSTRAQTESAC